MSSVRHLQQRLKELQQQYDLLSEKIRRLRADSAIQASTSVAYQLEKEIDRSEAERDRLLKQIQTIERSLDNERIHGELFRLNYVQQVRLFREFIEEKRIGAFLSRRALRTDIAALWRELGRQMGVQNFSSHEEIAKNPVAQLQTQHIILVFHDFDCIDEDYLHELIRDFWLPLVNSTQQTIHPTNEFFLLMFLVDHEGCVSNWKIQFADQFDPVWEPCIPIRLPIIDRLSDRVLANWMENAIDALPTKVTKKIDYTVQIVLEKSEGVPERVFAWLTNWVCLMKLGTSNLLVGHGMGCRPMMRLGGCGMLNLLRRKLMMKPQSGRKMRMLT